MFFYIILIPLIILTLITFYNLLTVPRIKFNKKLDDQRDLVSILIPARNEENNIEKALLSAINQTYLNTEIIVLDDKSTDNTSEKVLNIIKKYPTKDIKIYNGVELPEGWNGKSWACCNLSKYAKGKYILFIDADVILRKFAVESALVEIKENEFDLLTVFSTQIYKSIGERLAVQICMNFPVGGLLPVRLSQYSKLINITGACGQFMFFKKEAYDAIGGHSVVGKKIVEEMEMALAIKKKGFKMGTYIGNEIIYCRMYEGFNKSINGFSNTFYPLTRMDTLVFLLFLFLLPGIFFWPFILVFFDSIFIYLILIIILNRIMLSAMFKESVLKGLIYHPFQMILFTYIGLNSLIRTKKGKIVWKERTVLNEI